ncbi:a-factor receptor [Marasmius sp. AFHP31]|nr:a-factor receptor [Marasmius sp. AFHP31]
MAYPNEVYSVFSFLAFVLVSIPLPWHLEAWNTGTCCFMIWTGLGCFNYFINSVVWHGSVSNVSPVWCDISAKFIVGIAVALPACSLCINRRLYHIATANAVTVTRAEKRRAIMVDLAICIGIPVLNMTLHYITQGHRFDIYEDVGCFPSVYNTWVAFVLVWTWPLVIALVSSVYSVLCLKAFNKRRLQFKELLSKNNNLNVNRYTRLMCLAGIDILITVPFSIYSIALNANVGISRWISWEDTHLNFSRVDLYPALLWKSNWLLNVNIELTRWAPVMCALLFFGFFGFADEAKKNYRAVISSVQKRVGLDSTGSLGSTLTGSGAPKSMTSSGNSNVLPIFIQRETRKKHDSLGSFTDVESISESRKCFELRPVDPNASYDELSIADVGGALADDNDAAPPPSTGSRYSMASAEPEPTKKDRSDMV